MSINKRIILAAGHGGGDSGAAAQGTTEYVENIQITDKVAYYLRQAGGIEVHVVPHTLNLGPSIDWVNARWKGLTDGIAIEIHKNSGGGTGSEVWTPSYPDATAKEFSQKIADELAKATGLPNRGVKFAQNNRWGRLGWCDDVLMYACLVEAGFIDVDPVNDDFDSKYARGIANGILAYFKTGSSVPAPSPKPTPSRKSNETIADEVINRQWGDGEDRKNRLRAHGYDYATIQAIVNRKLGVSTSKAPVTSNIVDRVINGEFGNMPERADRLRAEGFDPNTVQAAVNARLGVAGAAPASQAITVGSKVVVTNPVDVNGVSLGVSGTYDVIQVNGDRIVIGKGSVVTAAVRRQNLRRV